jgi:hypothetical protein
VSIRATRFRVAQRRVPLSIISPPSLLRKLEFLPRLYLPLVLLLCAAYAWRPLDGGDDVWAHAAVGRWSWHHASVPHHTLFLWGAPPVPWVAHSWLSQLVFYGLLTLGGDRYGPHVVLAFTVLVVALVFTSLWRLWTRHAAATVFTPLVFSMAILGSALRFRPRPELFTALFLVILLTWIIAWSGDGNDEKRSGKEKRSLYRSRGFHSVAPAGALPFLFVLWANFHGAMTVGLALLGTTAICDFLQDHGDRRSRALILVTAICIAATLINPFGMDYWAEVARSVRSETFTYIDEWKPFWKPPALAWHYALYEAALVLIAALAWLCNPRRRWAQGAWLLLMSAAFLSSRRHLWLLAIVAVSVMAANARSFDMGQLWHEWRRRTRQAESSSAPAGLRRVAQAGAIACLLAWIITAPGNLLAGRAVSRTLPEGMARTIVEKHVPAPLFNDYEYSSYLQWRLNGAVEGTGQVPDRGIYPLFIDLLNAYPDQLMEDYFDILKATARGHKLLTKLNIRAVALGPHHRQDGIAKYVDGNAHWKRVYDEEDGSIWVRLPSS